MDMKATFIQLSLIFIIRNRHYLCINKKNEHEMAKGIPFQNLSTSSNNKDVYINPIPHPHYNLSTHRNSSILTPQPITSPTLKKKKISIRIHTHTSCRVRFEKVYTRERNCRRNPGNNRKRQQCRSTVRA